MPLNVQIVTPERQILSEDQATFVLVRTLAGEMGILPGIAPQLAALGTGQVKIETESGVRRMMIDGGFLIVKDDRCTILAEYAILADEVSVDQVSSEIEELRRSLAADEANDSLKKELARREALYAIIQIG